MPQMVTHYQFGLDVAERLHVDAVAATPETRSAFLLGNQGPDPFFYLVVSPGNTALAQMGEVYHAFRPGAFLCAAASYVHGLDGKRAAIGRAYLAGLACHYMLDRSVHPLVYFWQYAVIEAGVGLTEDDEDQIHMEIERDIDEAVLFARFNTTAADVCPSDLTLAAPESVLEVAGEIYAFVAGKVYGIKLFQEVFVEAVHSWRRLMHLTWSPTGKKRAALTALERAITGKSSILAGQIHKPRAEAMSDFANFERRPWKDPFTGKVRTESLEDLANVAMSDVPALVDALIAPEIDIDAIMALTAGLNFSGEAMDEGALDIDPALNPYRLVDNP